MATEALSLVGTAAAEPKLMTGARSGLKALRARINLGGALLDQVDLDGAVERVREMLATGGTHQVVTINLDFLTLARGNEQFLDTLNQADLAVADGMPLVWLSHLKRTPLPQRVAGVDLFSECCELAADEGRSVFLLGAAAGVADQAARQLVERYPGLTVAGVYAPSLGPLADEEDARIVRMIRDARPDFLFVALGAPRQDLWIRDHLADLEVPVSMGVGCVFDLVAGSVNRAPAWMQQSGLEWAFRLAQEPGRLWRRYLLNDLPMLVRLVVSKTELEPSTSVGRPS